MQTSDERRIQTSERIPYGLPIALSHDGYHEPFEAECVDLSPGGLSLRASCLPGLGETLTCHFAAPQAQQQLEVRGEVVWAHLEGHRGGEFGVRFLDADATTIALISEMIGEQQSRVRRDSAAASNNDTTAHLAVDGSADTFTARLLRRGAGLVTFEQDLSFLKLGRGVSAYQGNGMQRGEIASVAVRLDGTTPKLMVTLRYEPSETPDDAHTRDDAVTSPHLEAFQAKGESGPMPELTHDTVADLDAPVTETSGKHAVTLTEFDAAYRTHAPTEDGLPELSTRSEFDLPSAQEEAHAALPIEADATDAIANLDDDEDPGPALFTADEVVEAKVVEAKVVEAKVVETADDVDEDARYEEAAARMLGDRPAEIPAASVIADAHEATVGRCDPSVMFRVDESDEDFRLPKTPSALTMIAGVILAQITLVRGFALSLWQQAQTKLLPRVTTQWQALSQGVGPKAQALLSRARGRALPMLAAAMQRVGDTWTSLSQRASGRGRRRRTTSVPLAAATTAPTVNRRSMTALPEASKGPLRMLLLGVLAAAGLGLAGYALFSAPDPHVVPVHREINAPAVPPSANLAPEAAPVGSAPAVATPQATINAPAITLPAVPTALPAPSYEAGRIAAPSYPTIERAAAKPAQAPTTTSPTAVAPAALEGTGAAAIESDVVTSNGGRVDKRFGAASVRGRQFTLHMSAPVKGLVGTADAGGFSVVIDGALSLDRAGPIAANHSAIARSMILNKGDRAELTIRFNEGRTPKYQVLAKADTIEITIEE